MLLDLILPVRVEVAGRAGELERATCGLVPSLIRSGYDSLASSFTIVCPFEDVRAIEVALSPFKIFDFRILTDEVLLRDCGFDEKSVAAVPGWYRQQLLKLAAARLSTATLVLILDADVIAVRPIDSTKLRHGLIPYQVMGVELFRGWFEASADALEIDFRTFTNAQLAEVMGVTPEFLSPATIRRLIERLCTLAPDGKWGPYLMSKVRDYKYTWTEYSLYWTFHSNLQDPDIRYGKERLYRFIEEDTLLNDFLEKTPQYFAVLQSTKLTLEQCRRVYALLQRRSTE